MSPSHTDEGLRAAVEARLLVPGSPVLVLSQYVEVSYADDLLADGAGAIGYLLTDRVTATTDFLDAVARVASGGTVLDREVLTLMAEGRSNTNIARTMVVSDGTVEKRICNIFAKLMLPPVLTYLRGKIGD